MPDLSIGPKVALRPSGFKFGPESVAHLADFHPDGVVLVCTALMYSAVDFGVCDGSHTRDEQERLVRMRASTGMGSRHVAKTRAEGGNGYCHAVHLYPYLVVAGKERTDWSLLYQVEAAVKIASGITKIPYLWGGVKKGRAQDGQHFELPLALYPCDAVVTQEQRDAAAKILKEMVAV